MTIRTLLSAAVVAVLAALCTWLHGIHVPELRIAAGMNGAYWYAIRWDDRHVGYLATTAGFDAVGAWRYRSRTHILMAPGEPLNIDKTLRFNGSPPHQLLEARQTTRQGGSSETTTLSARDGQLIARTAYGARPLEWHYALADYLAVERWLDTASPVQRSWKLAPTLDISETRKVQREYKLANTSPLTVAHDAPLGPTEIELDERYVPRRIVSNALFHFDRVSFTEAMAPADPMLRKSYKVPLDEPLANVGDIASLELHFEGAPLVLHGRRGQTSGALSAPQPQHPAIEALAEDIAASTSAPEDQLSLMVTTVYQRLAYREGTPPSSPAEALARGYGECTDFAELVTALAQSFGWPARTVYGLAYDDARPAGLSMHAWNEVEVNGERFAVDATADRLNVDATHIELSDRVLAELKFLQGSDGLTARAVNVRYD